MDSKNIVISFSDYQVPQFKEVKGSAKWVKAGEDNKYPDYLLDLFQRSPKHASIVRKKSKYILGKGFAFTDKKKKTDVLDEVNTYGESLNKVGSKSILDLELQGGFYLQIIWTKGKKIGDVIHLDYHKVRSNEDNTEFYYREKGWTGFVSKDDKDIKAYPAFDAATPKGSQVLYYKEYAPGLDTYSLPEYINALNHIESDSLVAEHVLNNAKTGFTASKMINFFNGEPESEEAKVKIEKSIKEKYSGKKGSKIIISFNEDPAKAPVVLDLGASDLTKEDFAHVDNLISANIFKGHQVTSPILFGEKTEGQLGGRSEMRDAYEIFQNTYIDDKQAAVAEVFNMIGPFKGWSELVIIPKEPIGLTLQEYKALGVPEAFLMDKLGIDTKKYPLDKPQPTDQKFSDDDEVISHFASCGEPAVDYDILKKKKTIDAIAEQLAFSAIEQTDANILDLIRKDKRVTVETIAKTLNYPTKYIDDKIESLKNDGYIREGLEKVGDDTQIVREVLSSPEVKPVTTDIFIKYSYEGPYDDRNRAFCHKMMELNRLYSRSEIEQISQRVGYSVWERRGGFYHNPVTDETTPYCRHSWMQNIVIKRK